MDIKAIVYTSETGHTARYAALLSQETGLPAVAMSKADLPKGTPVIYMGWLMASHVKALTKARRKFEVKAVCGVGLCPTGALLKEIRAAEKLEDEMPLFTLQGGMDHARLKGINKFMIQMLIKMLSRKKDPTPEDAAQLELIKKGGDYVSPEHLSAVLKWYNE